MIQRRKLNVLEGVPVLSAFFQMLKGGENRSKFHYQSKKHQKGTSDHEKIDQE